MRCSGAAGPALFNRHCAAFRCARAAGAALIAIAVWLSQPGGIGSGPALAEPVAHRALGESQPGLSARVASPASGTAGHADSLTKADRKPPAADAALPDEIGPDEPAAVAKICALIESQARRHKLPASFFTRLLWKESLFDADAVSPKGAQGIAQFMPATAVERGLADPFDPDEAIPHSARFLRELHGQFGNLGLAAAAYNAGPQRVTSWLSGRSSLPAETLDYVLFITGRAAADWQDGLAMGDPAAADNPELEPECSDFVALASRGLIDGRMAAARRLPSAPAVARHPGHRPMGTAIAARQQAADRPDQPGGEPVVSRLKGKGKPIYAVEGRVQSHAQARRTCSRLRASGSYCVVVIR